MTADLDRIRHALSFVPPDDRDTWVRMAMSIKSMVGEDGFQDWDEWSQAAESYKAADALSCWKSCSGNGAITAGTLFYEAAKHGWKEEPTEWVDPAAVHSAREAAKERAQHEQAKKDRDRDIAAVKASELWAKGTWADGHPYLTRKSVTEVPSLREISSAVAEQILGYTPQSGGAKLEGRLLMVPVKIRGRLSTMELIDESGRKTSLAHGAKKCGWWATGPLPDTDGAGTTILIGEGVATALSAYKATGAIAVAALGSGNLTAVVIDLHGNHPHARLIVLADLLKTTGAPDPHAIAAGKAVDCAVAIPVFQDRRQDQTDFNDMASEYGIDAVKKAIYYTEKTEERVLKLLSMDDFLSVRQPIRFAIEGMFPMKLVTLLGAHGGMGKSMLSLVFACHVACGRAFASHASVCGRALYVSLEDDEDMLKNRLRMIVAAYGLDAESVRAGVTILDGSSGNSALAVEGRDKKMEKTKAMDEIHELSKDYSLIIIDNATDAFFGNENDRGQVRSFMRMLAILARSSGAAVLLLAHIDKFAARNGAQGNTYSGSTAWHNSSRSRLAMTEKQGLIDIEQEKLTVGRKIEKIPMMWTDSGVIVPATCTGAQDTRAEDAEAVLAAILAAQAAGVHVPPGRSGPVTAQKALDTFAELPVTLRGTGGRERFWLAVARLMADGRVVREIYHGHDRKTREHLTAAGKCGQSKTPW